MNISKHIKKRTNKALSLYGEDNLSFTKTAYKLQRKCIRKEIVSQVATQLQSQFGKRGFLERNLRRMLRLDKAVEISKN